MTFVSLEYVELFVYLYLYIPYIFLFFFQKLEGMQSARNLRIIQPTNESKQRTLPKYDFPLNLVNATPGVSRFMTYGLMKDGNGKDVIKIEDSDVIVFNRPKAFVGSSGSVWASEYMRMRHTDISLFLVNKTQMCNGAGNFNTSLIPLFHLNY